MTRKKTISISLDPVVLKNSKVLAASQGYRSFSALVEDLLRKILESPVVVINHLGLDQLERVDGPANGLPG